MRCKATEGDKAAPDEGEYGGKWEEAPSPEGKHADQERTLASIEEEARRVTRGGIIAHARGKARGAGRGNKERQPHEAQHHYGQHDEC